MSNYMVRVKVNPEPPKKRMVGGMLLVRWRCSGQPGDTSMLIVKKPKKKMKLCAVIQSKSKSELHLWYT